MRKIKICIYIAFILSAISSANAVSFDCNKASRASEKAICSNVELSALDDELSIAYKKALLINPNIKSNQREWIQATRLCESNTATLNSCIKSAYSSRIAFLTNKKIPAEVIRVEPLVKEAEAKKIDSVAENNVPVKAIQQQTPQPSQHLRPNNQQLASTPTFVAPELTTASSKLQSVIEPLNLKGFNLKMSKGDVRKIIPNIESSDYFLVDGKMRTTLSCGVLFSKNKSNCSFTYAGMEINGIVAAFWGADLMFFKLIYNTGSRVQVDYNNFRLGSIMKAALVSKYGLQGNTNSSYSGRWIFGSEKMFLELEDDSYGLYGPVVVSNSILVTKYQTLLNGQNEEKSKKSEAENKKKTLSDM